MRAANHHDGLIRASARSNFSKTLAALAAAFGIIASANVLAQVSNVQAEYPENSAGGWSNPSNVIGPPDDSCSNMGAVGVVNNTYDYGFSIPNGATITGFTAHTKTGEQSTQMVQIALARDANVEPPTDVGTLRTITVPDVGNGACASTIDAPLGGTPTDWGLPAITPAQINASGFGVVYEKINTSSVKIDSICLEVFYTTAQGPAVQTGCFTVPFTVFKDFTDNSMASVDVTLTCNNGATVFANPLSASEAAPAVFGVEDPSGTATCTATEAVPMGYSGDDSDCQQGGLLADGGSCTIVNTPNLPSMAITKTVTNMGPFGAGDTINYTIEITNDGGVTLTNVLVNDALLGLADALCSASLAPMASCQVMGSYMVTQADIDNNGGGDGDIDNIAVGSSNEAGPEQATAEAQLETPDPSMAVTKMVTNTGGGAGGSFQAGDTIMYTIEVTNDGNTTLTNVTVSDPLLGLVDVLCSASLAPMASCQVMGSYMVTQADIDNNGGGDGDIDNTADANSDQTGTQQAMAAAELEGQNPSIMVGKTVDNTGGGAGGTFQAGDTIMYTVTVTNNGNVTLTNVVVSDPLLGLTDEPCSASLAPGDSCQVMGSYMVTQADIDDNGGGDGDIDNTATGNSDQAGPQQAMAAAELEGQAPSMMMTKVVTNSGTGPGGTFTVDDTIMYTIEVSNDGNVDLTNVIVSDPLLGLMNAVCSALLIPGDSCQVMGTYMVTQGDIDDNGGGDGDIDNTATADSDQAGPEQAMAAAPLEGPAPAMSMTKTITNSGSGPGGTFDAGDTIMYTIEVSNDGNVDLTNVVVSDPLLGLMDAVCSALLIPGDSCQVMGTYMVTQMDIDDNGGGDGDIDNTATADSDQAGPQQASAAAPLVVAGPDIDLVKSANPTTYSMAGDMITYSFLVTNTGNVTLFDIVVSDPLITDPPNSGSIMCPSGNPIPSLASGVSETCTGIYTVTEDDVLAGEITNLATVTAECMIIGRGEPCTSDDDSEVIEGESLRTTFRVTKDFSDDNPLGVVVTLNCNTGLPLQQQGVVHDPDAAGLQPGDFTVIEFVVNDFLPGTMNCDLTEVIPAGYEPTYTAGATTGIADSIFDDEGGCHYELIEGGQFTCDIFNDLQPVDVIVEKEWIDEHPEYQLPTIVEIGLECDAEIIGGFPCLGVEGNGDNYCAFEFIDPNNPGEFEVYPHFDGTECTATEELIDGVLTDESDCESMILFPGQGDGCVIVNTRLFAGIPTLSQYGLILLALMMLGIGAVAYRRFI